MPGLLLQLAIFGAGFAGFGIIQELREGVIDRQRVTPARRLSLILGRTLSNIVTIGVQAVVLVAVAIPFGLDPSLDGVAVSIVIICVLAIGISAASYAMGLILKDEDAFAPFIQGVSLPLLLLSGVLLPMSLAPTWLRNALRTQPAHARGRRHAQPVPRRLLQHRREGRAGGPRRVGRAGLVGNPPVRPRQRLRLPSLPAWTHAPASISTRRRACLRPASSTTGRVWSCRAWRGVSCATARCWRASRSTRCTASRR